MSEFEELISNYQDMNFALVKTPTNTIARILNIEHKENLISDWIAFLLDPRSLGRPEVLNGLLAISRYKYSIQATDDVKIHREYTFSNQRRIDFYIETSELIIGIENKIWSDLGYHQLDDYSKSLKKIADEKTKSVCEILLYPSKNKCESIGKVENGKDKTSFSLVTYEEFAKMLKDIRINFIDNMRFSFLLQDFIAYVEEYLMENNEDFNFELYSFLYENKEQISKIEENKKIARQQFSDMMKKKIYEKYSDLEWEIYAPGPGNYFQLYKLSSKGWGASDVHYELLPEGDKFPYSRVHVVLHTHENKFLSNNSEYLRNLPEEVAKFLKDKYGSDIFELDYKNGSEGYMKSLDAVVKALDLIAKKYTILIDNELEHYDIDDQRILPL